jgi:endonuclease YncB( thermonuclease family)
VHYILRSMFRLVVRQRTREHPRHHQPVKPVNTEKNHALVGSAALEIVDRFPRAKVVHVVDGDTVIVAKQCNKITIRLDSIDCPEDGQHWGDIAAYGLIKLIGGKKVHLEEHGLDSHGRTLATVYVRHADAAEWVNVNERMVTLGHAWVMRRFYDHLPKDRQDKLNRLERWARSKKVGLWRFSNPTPPWRWRYEGRGNSTVRTSVRFMNSSSPQSVGRRTFDGT